MSNRTQFVLFLTHFFNSVVNDDYHSETEINQETISLELEKERIDFLNLIENANFNEKSTSNFWLKNKSKMPYLAKLATILINIPSSSAFIERFYSLTGNVCQVRAGNMNTSTIVKRCMLKTNIQILTEKSIK